MTIKEAVLEAAEEVLGLEQEEVIENMDMDLREAGLIDSVGIAAMFTYIEDLVNKSINTKTLNFDDFTTMNSIVSAIERAMK